MLEKYATINAIKTLVLHPNSRFSVRGLAMEAKISPGAAGIALAYMKECRMASLKVIGRTYQYKANLQSPLCRQWKLIFSLEEIERCGLVKNILSGIPRAVSILLFGSMGRGTDDEKSDCDILVIATGASRPDLRRVAMRGRETNLVLMSPSEWKKKAKEDKIFYENVIYDSVVLFGNRPVVL